MPKEDLKINQQTNIPFEYEINSALFKPINYLGSKLRILDFIETTINKIDPSMGRVYDLFAGSGVVSRKLSLNRPITAIDIQEYSRTITSALLLPINDDDLKNDFINKIISSEYAKKILWAIDPLVAHENNCLRLARTGEIEPLCDLVENGSIIKFENKHNDGENIELGKKTNDFLERINEAKLDLNSDAMMIRYAGGIYFSYLQAAKIDIIRHFIDHLDIKYKDIFMAALLSTASEAVNTVGKQFAQPLKLRDSKNSPKISLINKVLTDRSIDIITQYNMWINKYTEANRSPFNHRVLKMDYYDALQNISSDTKVVYADPPYTRDHYSRYYHILESICLKDSPKVSTIKINGRDQLSRGVYREDRHQSLFCIKSKAHGAFDQLFSKVSDSGINLVLSYSPYNESLKSRPRLLTIEQILNLAKNYFKEVDMISAGYFKHSKLNNSEKHLNASDNAELLIVCLN